METIVIPSTTSPENEETRVAFLERLLEERTQDLQREYDKTEELNRRLMSVLQSMYCAVLVTNSSLELELVNNVSEQILGISLVDILQLNLKEVLPLEELKQNDEDLIFQLHGLEREILYHNPVSGRKIPILVQISAFFYKHETASGLVCLCTDLSKRKTLEQNVLHAQKLESIGTLAAGIAHEINTPIQYIRDNTSFVREEVPHILKMLETVKTCDGVSCTVATLQSQLSGLDYDFLQKELPLALDQTIEGANSVAKIVRSLKEFSHPGSLQKEPVNLNATLESTITISRNEWKYVAEVEFIPDTSLSLLSCYPGELNQAFLNIIVNAAHAIEAKIKSGFYTKGKIRVATQYLPDGVLIVITDNGVGIPKDIQAKVFDPFFTTKEVGRGTGQGLSLVHAFINERHGGDVSFESEEGVGTTFKIFLPTNQLKESPYENIAKNSFR